jgi:hypothetical protein
MRTPRLQLKQGLKEGWAFLRETIYQYFTIQVVWYHKRCGLWWEWHCKRGTIVLTDIECKVSERRKITIKYLSSWKLKMHIQNPEKKSLSIYYYIPIAIAVLPVPGWPAINIALPAIFPSYNKKKNKIWTLSLYGSAYGEWCDCSMLK